MKEIASPVPETCSLYMGFNPAVGAGQSLFRQVLQFGFFDGSFWFLLHLLLLNLA